VEVAPTTLHSKTTAVVVVVEVEVPRTTSTTVDLTVLTQLRQVMAEVLTAKLTYLVVMLHRTLVLVVVVVLTTAQITMVELVVLELWSSDTKSEPCLNDKLLHGGL
jgi:hypothetical protein